ncbi:MAG TPA: STAS domain-containing protein [Opitutaceae bacterium]|jgi:stage II sporulation protein AA (anti-sigma F factor antagonist)|nr:STAS domain-containing protein [Opitutaceae bacterium]
MFDVSKENEGTHVRIILQGDLTSATAPQLESALAGYLAGGGPPDWLLDLGQLGFSSSAGLRVFLAYAKKIKNAKGRLVLCNLQPNVREVFDLSGFTQIFTIESGADEARRHFAA